MTRPEESNSRPSRRRNKESLKKLVVQAGLDLLDRDGLRLGTESISYAKVFDYLETEYSVRVTRASVHERIWASHDAFRQDVLAETVNHIPAVNPIDSSSLASMFDSDLDATARTNRLAQQIGSALLSQSRQQPQFEQLLSAKAIAIQATDQADVQTLQERLDERAEGHLAATATRFPILVERLGLVPRVETAMTANQAAAALRKIPGLLFVGGHLNYRSGSSDIAESVDVALLPGVGSEPWSIASLGVKALLDFLYEPGPEIERSPPSTYPESASLSPRPPEVADGIDLSKPRRTRGELRRLVLLGGVELLLQHGIELRPESLGYSAVLKHLNDEHDLTVHSSSIHKRIWPSVEDYWMEVLTYAAGRRTDAYSTTAEAQLDIAVSKDMDASGRHRAALDIIRRIAASHFEIGANSVEYRQRLLMQAALIRPSTSSQTKVLRTAIIDTDRQRSTRAKDLLDAVVTELGFEVKPELGLPHDRAIELTSNLAMTTAIGAIFDHLAGIRTATHPYKLPRAGDDTQRDLWPPNGIASRAYFEQFFQVKQDVTS